VHCAFFAPNQRFLPAVKSSGDSERQYCGRRSPRPAELHFRFRCYRTPYLRAYDSVSEARAAIGRYLEFYNRKRPHSSLDARTPDRAYFDGLPLVAAA
jgi:putative transposase